LQMSAFSTQTINSFVLHVITFAKISTTFQFKFHLYIKTKNSITLRYLKSN
jgi:hypothetical protein